MNFISIDDLKFLRNLHTKFGINYLIYDEKGVRTNNHSLMNDDYSITDYFCILSEISKRIKMQMNGYFEIKFTDNFDYNVQKI